MTSTEIINIQREAQQTLLHARRYLVSQRAEHTQPYLIDSAHREAIETLYWAEYRLMCLPAKELAKRAAALTCCGGRA